MYDRRLIEADHVFIFNEQRHRAQPNATADLAHIQQIERKEVLVIASKGSHINGQMT
jgi:hypothetical protein